MKLCTLWASSSSPPHPLHLWTNLYTSCKWISSPTANTPNYHTHKGFNLENEISQIYGCNNCTQLLNHSIANLCTFSFWFSFLINTTDAWTFSPQAWLWCTWATIGNRRAREPQRAAYGARQRRFISKSPWIRTLRAWRYLELQLCLCWIKCQKIVTLTCSPWVPRLLGSQLHKESNVCMHGGLLAPRSQVSSATGLLEHQMCGSFRFWLLLRSSIYTLNRMKGWS